MPTVILHLLPRTRALNLAFPHDSALYSAMSISPTCCHASSCSGASAGWGTVWAVSATAQTVFVQGIFTIRSVSSPGALAGWGLGRAQVSLACG